MTPSPLIILGAGGHAREVADLARACANDGRLTFVAFATTTRAGPDLLGAARVLTVAQASREYPGARYVCGIGDPDSRARVVLEAEALGLRPVSLIHPNSTISPTARISEQGVAIFAGAVLSTDVIVEPHAHINFNATISHDCEIGAFALVSPGAHIAGNVVVGERALIGIGATVMPGRPGAPLRIGTGAIVGAGACVTQSVQDGSAVAGVPARPLPRRTPRT